MTTTLTRAALIEDIEWALTTGETDPAAIAGRLNTTPAALDKRLRAAGRPDLIDRMACALTGEPRHVCQHCRETKKGMGRRESASAEAHSLKAPRTRMPSWEGAACAERLDVMYADDPSIQRIARSLCHGCPIRDACLAYAMDVEAETTGGRYGIWGGLAPDQRAELARRAS